MKFRDLLPEFISVTDAGIRTVESISEATGVVFLCPKCVKDSGKVEGAHSIICTQPGAPSHVSGGPGRWTIEGTGMDDITLTGEKSSSVMIPDGCKAHFYVRSGEICFA